MEMLDKRTLGTGFWKEPGQPGLQFLGCLPDRLRQTGWMYQATGGPSVKNVSAHAISTHNPDVLDAKIMSTN